MHTGQARVWSLRLKGGGIHAGMVMRNVDGARSIHWPAVCSDVGEHRLGWRIRTPDTCRACAFTSNSILDTKSMCDWAGVRHRIASTSN